MPAQGLTRTFAASLLVLALAMAALLEATDLGHGFTTEALRRAAVERSPVPIPDYALTDASGRATSLRRIAGADGRVWIVDFVYTRCRSVCSALGSVFQQLQAQIVERGLQGRVGLLSISFDPLHDDPAALRGYAQRMRMDPAVWRIATMDTVADRQRMLDAFGIMVVAAPLGEFEHNAALHIVDPDGRLVHIVDYDDPQRALETAVAAAR
jgi:protein SCO1/2